MDGRFSDFLLGNESLYDRLWAFRPWHEACGGRSMVAVGKLRTSIGGGRGGASRPNVCGNGF